MEEEELHQVLSVVYWLWHAGKVGQDTIEAALRIRAHQGKHEAEVSCGGEADLHKHVKSCKKNPNHSHFIPVQDFKIEHLPSGYHDNDIFEWIKAQADLTCRLSVRHTSKSRPKYHPIHPFQLYPFSQDRGGNWIRMGSGWVSCVYKYTAEDNKYCECKDCSTPGTLTPHKVWAKLEIMTAMHVVFDDDEARHTTCHFDYNTSRTLLHRHCLKLTELKVESSDIKGDWCLMTYATHDMDIVNKLYKIFRHRVDLMKKVYHKYSPNRNTGSDVPGVPTDPEPVPVVIIGHPHGQSKQVSVGMWTHRETWSDTERDESGDLMGADRVFTSYTYNAPTCPGSSGGPVIRMPEKGRMWWFTTHPHSGGGQDNNENNASAVMDEFVSVPGPT